MLISLPTASCQTIFIFLYAARIFETVFRSAEKEQVTIANHFVTEKSDYSTFLSMQFKRLFTSYSSSFNRTYARTGSLFEARFKRVLIPSDEGLLYTLYYIHHNPVKHNYVNQIRDWRFLPIKHI